MSKPNWGNLVAKGRAKAHGVPWSDEEAAARALGIPAEFVRSGILTVEEYEKAKAADQKDGAPLDRLPRNELVKLAQEAGIEFTPDAPADVLATLLKNHDPKEAEKAQKEKEKAEKAAQKAKEAAEKKAAKEAEQAAKAAKKAAEKAAKDAAKNKSV